MSKLKARLDKAVADDLGILLSSETLTLKDVASLHVLVDGLVFAYEEADVIYYDVLPVWRIINGMRIKIPKFQSRPVIEERLAKQQYRRYYALINGGLYAVKVSKPSDLKRHLPFKINDDAMYRSTRVIPDQVMGLRKKSLLFHRQRQGYELQTPILA